MSINSQQFDPSMYDQEQKNLLKKTRERIVLFLEKNHTHEKINGFLNKCAIIGINNETQKIHIGIPNEFVATQVKKFFGKDLTEAIHQIYNNQFTVSLDIFQPFNTGKHELQINIPKLIESQSTKINKPLSSTTKLNQPLPKEITYQLSNHFGILFEKKFQLSNFVVGEHNRLAFAAAQAIAQNPGQTYNPFFIFGNVGLGKTHLMQATGNQIISNHPQKTVVYLPSNKLIDEIIESIKKNKMSNFLKKFDDVDVLIIDDIQFLAGKEKTQDIFYTIFNELYSKQKQIIMCSDRPPKELDNIPDRLKSRFSSGMVADITPPDFETRVAIIEQKLKMTGEKRDKDIIELLAHAITDNIREIEGALNVFISKKTLLKRDLSKEDIEQGLKTLGYKHHIIQQEGPSHTINTKTQHNFHQTIENIAHYFSVSSKEILGDSRKKDISQIRQLSMYIAKKHFGWTLEKIGDFFGGKNHTTVIYAIEKCEKTLKTDTNFHHDYQTLCQHHQR